MGSALALVFSGRAVAAETCPDRRVTLCVRIEVLKGSQLCGRFLNGGIKQRQRFVRNVILRLETNELQLVEASIEDVLYRSCLDLLDSLTLVLKVPLTLYPSSRHGMVGDECGNHQENHRGNRAGFVPLDAVQRRQRHLKDLNIRDHRRHHHGDRQHGRE